MSTPRFEVINRGPCPLKAPAHPPPKNKKPQIRGRTHPHFQNLMYLRTIRRLLLRLIPRAILCGIPLALQKSFSQNYFRGKKEKQKLTPTIAAPRDISKETFLYKKNEHTAPRYTLRGA